jgi:hypothetical protein
VANKASKSLIIPFIMLTLIGCSPDNPDANEKNSIEEHENIVESATTDYISIQNVTYHVLKEEYLVMNDENNPEVNSLFREYDVFESNGSFFDIRSVTIPKKDIETIDQAKKWLETYDSEWLQLKPLTIVSEKVLTQWMSESYEAEYEYWDGSPKGLTLETLKKE